MTIKTLAEKYITVILSILQGMPSRQAGSHDPSLGKQSISNDRLTGTEQSVNFDDHSSIS